MSERGRRRGTGLLAALACLAVASLLPLAASELDAEGVADRLQEWIEGTVDLQGRFEQTLTSGALGAGLAESGRVYLLRPGRMRWDYLEPERKIALVDGEATLLYLEEEAQLWEGRLEDGGLLATLLAGTEPVEHLFEPALLATPTVGGEGAYLLRLVPRGDEEAFRHVVLTLRAPLFALETAEVLDGAGNLMRYRFAELERNGGLPETLFRFEAPPGTEVVRP